MRAANAAKTRLDHRECPVGFDHGPPPIDTGSTSLTGSRQRIVHLLCLGRDYQRTDVIRHVDPARPFPTMDLSFTGTCDGVKTRTRTISRHISLDEIVAHFQVLEDPRSSINGRHTPVGVIVIAVLAVLAGASVPTAIAE